MTTQTAHPASVLDVVAAYLETKKLALTKREYFAAMAMQGLIAGGPSSQWNEKNFAIGTVNLADALIAELSK